MIAIRVVKVFVEGRRCWSENGQFETELFSKLNFRVGAVNANNTF